MKSTDILNEAISWDVVNWSKAVAFWEDKLPEHLKGLRVLELGCGTNGGLTLWFAYRGAGVVCSGYGGVPPEPKAIHRKHSLVAGIIYENINALAIPYENKFDIICFKSMLGGIERDAGPGAAALVIAQIHKALKPGGKLLFAENLVATPLHSFLRKAFGAGKNKWHYFTIEEINSLAADKFEAESKMFGVTGLFGYSEPVRRILGNLDTMIFEKVLPKSVRYIYAGVWVKK